MSDSLEREVRELRALYWSERDPQGRGFAPLADAYRRSGDLDQALNLVNDGLARHPDFASGHVVAARIQLALGDSVRAAASFITVLDLDRDNVEALSELSMLHQEGGRATEALELARRLAELLPGDPRVSERVRQLEAALEVPLEDDGDADAGPEAGEAEPAQPDHDAAAPLEARDPWSDPEPSPGAMDAEVAPEARDPDAPFEPAAFPTLSFEPDAFDPDALEAGTFELSHDALSGRGADEAGEDDAPDAGEVEAPDSMVEAQDPGMEADDPAAEAVEPGGEVVDVAAEGVDAAAEGVELTPGADDPTAEAGEAAPGADAVVSAEPGYTSSGGPAASDPSEEVDWHVPDDDEPENDGSEEDLYTRTLGDLYAAQGLTSRAIDVYRHLVEAEPDDRELAARLAELEGRPVEPEWTVGERTHDEETDIGMDADGQDVVMESDVTGPGADPGDAALEAMAEDLSQAPEDAGPLDTPFAWSEAEAEKDDGPPVAEYFSALLAWSPGAPAAEVVPIADLAPAAEAASEPAAGPAEPAAEAAPDEAVPIGRLAPDEPVVPIESLAPDAPDADRVARFQSWMQRLKK